MINSPTRQTTPRTILVVEDEPTLATAIAQRITAEGWSARVASDGASAVQAAKQLRPDLVIMDIMLPVMDGLEATKRIVADRPVPVLILTARDAEADKVIGLGAGADDYMTKPFSPAELMAHLRALTRRQGEVLFEAITSGDVSLNLESHDLTCGDQSIHLSYKEFSLARVLMANAGAAVSKATLIEKVWGLEAAADENNVEAYVSFLRKKLRFLGSASRIETLRGAGYRFAAEGAATDNRASA